MAEDGRGRNGGWLDNLGTWSEQQAADFELARAVIGSVIAAYSSRLGRTEDPAERDDLLAAQQRYMRERRLLTLDDREQIERILRDYPAAAREVSGLR
ncbi:hypothetical protein [Micromonospora sp. KC721]|uniref:hypothetical protein n=1 Tax=Micromonospora sp. KC721 TaxID=2530380 RepID=UPI0010454861|nr:hypothetical protein [Micromonospora sp. KC721]TDB81577.1 hypothetical protein E1182_04905 [Micromonospora sp. KC721]